MMNDTLETVRKIIARKYDLPLEGISAESTLESLNLDSLDVIETLFDVEDAFKIRIPQDRGEGVAITTVRDVVNIVTKLVQQQHPKTLAGESRS